MKNQKVGILLGTIILVIIAITVGVFVWEVDKGQEIDQIAGVALPSNIKQGIKNQQETNAEGDCFSEENVKNIKWQEFKSDKFRFQVQYPASFSLYEQDADAQKFAQQPDVYFYVAFRPSQNNLKNNQDCVHSNEFSMFVSKNKSGLDDYIENAKITNGAVENSFELMGMETISDLEAKVIKTCDQGGNCNKDIFLNDKKYIYSIRIKNYFTSENALDKEISDRMLSTFKFDN